ncbi:MAG: phosphatidylglycerophosphatase A [Burkholderiales bacterium]|nr:phosphatidylglycerophosphatase A [Burkholderiales bacterium]
MAADSTTSRPPDARFLVSHPAHFIALGFGSGLSPFAPGTVGTLVAFPICWLLLQFLHPLAVAFVSIPLFAVGIWACGVTGRDLGVQDHGSMVWDEIVAFLPLAALASASLALEAVAFGLFRLFDIWKPFPIRDLERRVKGGLGVMIDDVVAAFYAYVAFVLFVVIVYKGFGYSG